MDGYANIITSTTPTEIIPEKINNQLFVNSINSAYDDNINVPVKLAKGVDEMNQIQLQSNENRVASDRINRCSNQIQVAPSQVPIPSDQQLVIGKFEDRNISDAESVKKAQKNQFSKRTINSATFEKNESQSLTERNASINKDACKIISAAGRQNSHHYNLPRMLIFGSHLHTWTDGRKFQTKPLAILVFTGNNDDLFNHILENLSTIIPSDIFTIFHLSYEAFCKHPWIGQSTACLIVADTSHLDDKCWIRLQQYFIGQNPFICQNKLLASLSACDNSKKTAKLLKMAFGERQSKKLGKDFEHFLKKALKTLHKEKSAMCECPFSDATSEELLHSGSTLIADALSRLSIKITTDKTIPSLTSGYFICEYDRMPWDMEGMHFNEPFGSKPKLLLKQISKHGPLPEVSKELLPIEVRTRAEHLPDFDDRIYFERLGTLRLGKALFYIPVCETTMEIGKSLAFAMAEELVVVVARQQIKGKGRSGNQWLSPVGCAMFTFNYMLSPESSLNNNVGIIQHIFCVAIVSGICSLRKELENFPLKIKWPNDLYYGRMCKMGGLIVNATTVNDKTVCILGAGLNLSNNKPTACINDFLPKDLRIRQEDYIANTLNKFQYYINLYENEGVDAFLKHYYRFWLHSRQSGKIMVVHPDGNTFDMMKGLITAKYV
ncbi:Biotin--protein ligase [Dirofilaria immitis]|nr:Biotin--protein ligase [Dirofilaria immitis]